MSARLLEGRPVAETIWRDVDARAARFVEKSGRAATLAVVGGRGPDAMAYARQVERQFTRHGLGVVASSPPVDEFVSHIRGFGVDPYVDGILLLTPLPEEIAAEQPVAAIDPSKDVDGQHPLNLGRLAQRRAAFAPATALGGLRLLQHYGIPMRGASVVVVGRSPVVGMPLALLLVDADATVTVCHSHSSNLMQFTQAADILCVATGRPGLIGPEHVKPGAVVVDFGSPAGDVQIEAVAQIASAITPVPGGTGPITVAVIAEQTLRAAELRRDAV